MTLYEIEYGCANTITIAGFLIALNDPNKHAMSTTVIIRIERFDSMSCCAMCNMANLGQMCHNTVDTYFYPMFLAMGCRYPHLSIVNTAVLCVVLRIGVWHMP